MPNWKGKARQTNSDPAGTLIPLNVVGSGVYDVAYTIPVHIGQDAQQFNLHVDTGSSDLWVASNACSSSSCGRTGGRSYNPSSATPTDFDFSITYLSGRVSGPVVWDRVEVGGYSIEYQALSAATSVEDEPLSSLFNGILGLALPLNSIIAENIPPVADDTPDGAAWASNLFSITPLERAPAARFLSLTLSRPGSDRIPSILGIGKHPPELVPDPTLIHYSPVIPNRIGTLYWKAGVRAITVYVDGQPRQVEIGRSNSGAVFPTAVLDSGVPFIFTTSALANAIYGAIDIHPAQDGKYYVPCRTPLNMTITLDNRPEIPLHPLDLTAPPPEDNDANFCIGLIQTADDALKQVNSGIGDMILGVPFMRNTYTVMAYTIPNSDGTFSTIGTPTGSGMTTITPRLGLMSLTDPTVAMEEFNRVRVLNEPLNDGNNSGFTTPMDMGGKKLSVGIIVLIAILGCFGFCFLLFGFRWFFFTRKAKHKLVKEREMELSDDNKALAFSLARRRSLELIGMPSEDTLRSMRYEAYKNRTGSISGGINFNQFDEFGERKREGRDSWINEDTLIAAGIQKSVVGRKEEDTHERRRHQRTFSDPTLHTRSRSVVTPLLSSLHVDEEDEEEETATRTTKSSRR